MHCGCYDKTRQEKIRHNTVKLTKRERERGGLGGVTGRQVGQLVDRSIDCNKSMTSYAHTYRCIDTCILVDLYNYQGRQDILATREMIHQDVESTLNRRRFNVVCPLPWLSCKTMLNRFTFSPLLLFAV